MMAIKSECKTNLDYKCILSVHSVSLKNTKTVIYIRQYSKNNVHLDLFTAGQITPPIHVYWTHP